MMTKYFFIKTEHPKIVRYSNGMTEVYTVEEGWVEQEGWYDRLFFNDFSDFEEVTEREANMFILGLKAT
ncbi:hypothetical protein DDV21_007560 [Streptococcus chenjunshii]|uniref:Uncharacterized protein n=1 Tax=Streptococcus chenjunshii TaxID=2173853 RepID=A0A372KMR7_9STRE|nr:hypothetical protein [Streptococcus chenjunshii]AXQ78950.1 hypothetical protein DDV21_007560 [Streptococcus chenjunshii]RFU51377.1 hypothetical protein DDV22_03450 [Streptococcus chenjunshii]RFU53577.1 hypothetical protein DDV23_03440 [Streptococcus chenjunshii]